MKPKTKPEPKIQIKISVAKSVAEACDLARKEAEDTPYDWNATMADVVAKENTEFTEHVAQHKAKVQPNVGLRTSPRVSTANGADPERA